jgi:alpha/beta hydrolase fold
MTQQDWPAIGVTHDRVISGSPSKFDPEYLLLFRNADLAAVSILALLAHPQPPRPTPPEPHVSHKEIQIMIYYRIATVEGRKVFYREAGDPNAPSLLLLHGFPTSSHMFRNLIPPLADRYHAVAPDLLGFGFSDAPDRAQSTHSMA